MFYLMSLLCWMTCLLLPPFPKSANNEEHIHYTGIWIGQGTNRRQILQNKENKLSRWMYNLYMCAKSVCVPYIYSALSAACRSHMRKGWRLHDKPVEGSKWRGPPFFAIVLLRSLTPSPPFSRLVKKCDSQPLLSLTLFPYMLPVRAWTNEL